MRIGVNSGSLPKHLHELERENPVEALVAAAVEYVELMDRLDFEDFKVSIKSTNVPNTIASNRLLSEKIDNPLHLGITEAGHEVVRLAQVGGRPRARCWPTGSATRSASRSPPSTRRRR